ncbi:helix-turn-helix domain-containing protein [Glutamicibacter sp. X7]
MHELGRYLQRKIDDRGWTVSELVRRSGLSRQTVYNLINDSREHMDQTPQRKTVNGLARALDVNPVEILTVSAQAIGVPVDSLPATQALSGASDQQILTELALRLSSAKGQHIESTNQSTSQPHRLRIRPVAPADRPGAGQKSDDGYPRPNDIELELEQAGFQQVHKGEASKHPTPHDERLAAHPPFESEAQKFERLHGERGEESQERNHE